MPTFQYTARRIGGQTEVGTLVAPSRRDLLQLLSSQSLFPVQVVEAEARPPGFFSWANRRVPAAAVAATFDQLAHLLQSGVPLLKAVEVLRDQTSDPTLHEQLVAIHTRIARGESLADTLRSYPETFSDLIVSLVHAGENGGFLEDSLLRIARLTERQAEIKSRVQGALSYPLFLVIIGAIVVAGMMTFFVPKFAPLFSRLQARNELPTATTILLSLSYLCQHYGALLLGALIGGSWLVRRVLHTEAGRDWLDQQKIRTPGLGPILRSLALSRFCRVLGTLLKNGVPLLRSLRIAKDATGNRILARSLQLAADNVSSGKSLVAPLRSSGQFPRELLEMIAVGETANRLDTLLVEMADRLDTQTQRKIDSLVKLIEPCLMLVMAAVIGFLVVALLMPVFAGNGL